MRAITDGRTPAQEAIARKWHPAANPVWNGITTDLLDKYHRPELESARILAYANAAEFDASIACFGTKFTYWYIRPTQADPAITIPAGLILPNHPSYPSAHSCSTGAWQGVLTDAKTGRRCTARSPLMIAAFVAACARDVNREPRPSRSIVTDVILTVDNRTPQSMVSYLHSGRSSDSLGEVPRRSARSVSLPRGAGDSTTALRLHARRSRADPGVLSQAFRLPAGHQVVWALDRTEHGTVTMR